MDIAKNDIIDRAIELERQSRDCYRQLGQKSISRYAGPALQHLAREEQRHMDILQEYRKTTALGETMALPDSSEYASIWEGFTAALEQVSQEIGPHTDEVNVIQRAISMEEQGLALYRQAQRDTRQQTGKAVFAFLAEQEVYHRDYLTKLLERLMILYQEPPEARPQL